MKLTDRNFVNLTHNICNTRVYNIHGALFSYTATRDSLVPYESNSIYDTCKHIMEQIQEGDSGPVNLMFGYVKGSLSKNKQKKLKKMLSEQKNGDVDVNMTTLSKWITLLL